MLLLAGAVLSLILVATWAYPATRTIRNNDYGGSIKAYSARVAHHNKQGDRVEIRAPICNSACTMYLGSDNLCIARRTRFGFHGPQSATKGLVLLPSQRAEAVSILAAHYPQQLKRWFMAGPVNQIEPVWLTGSTLIDRYSFTEC